MNIWLLNTTLSKVAIIDQYSSLIWADRYRLPGDIEIVLPATSYMLENLKKDYYLYIPQYSVCYIIETILLSTDIEGIASIRVTGQDLKTLIGRRIVWNGSPKLYNNILSGNMQTQALLTLDYAMGMVATPARRIPEMYFRINPSVVSAGKISKLSVLGENLTDVIKFLCTVYDIGYRCTLKKSNNMSEFDIVFGGRTKPTGITFETSNSRWIVSGLGSAFQTAGLDIEENEYKENTAYRVSARGNQTTANRTSLSFEYTDGTTAIAFSFQTGSEWTQQSAVSNPNKTLKRVRPTSSGTAVTTKIMLGSVQVVEASLPEEEYAPCSRYGWYFDFQLYKGKDRSYKQLTNPYVVFSPKVNNLIKTNYLTSFETWKNTALVGGEGEGNSRKFQQAFRHTRNMFLPEEAENVFFTPWGRSKKDPSKNSTRFRLKKPDLTSGNNRSGGFDSAFVSGPITVSFKLVSISSSFTNCQLSVTRDVLGVAYPSWNYVSGDVGKRVSITDNREGQITGLYIYFPGNAPVTDQLIIEDFQIEEGSEPTEYQNSTRSITGYTRREKFIDASSISSKTDNDGTVSAEVYATMLKSKGLLELNKSSQLQAFEGEVEGVRVHQYGSEYGLGDTVQIENEFGIVSTTTIEEVVYSEDPSGITLIPTFKGEADFE